MLIREREREKKRKYLNLSDLIDHQERKIIFSLYKVLNFSCKKKKESMRGLNYSLYRPY